MRHAWPAAKNCSATQSSAPAMMATLLVTRLAALFITLLITPGSPRHAHDGAVPAGRSGGFLTRSDGSRCCSGRADVLYSAPAGPQRKSVAIRDEMHIRDRER